MYFCWPSTIGSALEARKCYICFTELLSIYLHSNLFLAVKRCISLISVCNLFSRYSFIKLYMFQATLHRDVLYMAGQLGLDSPTMLIVDEGPASELKQALENSEAVANCFNCSVALSALFLIIYCSKSLNSSDRIAIENQKNVCLTQMKLQSDSQRMSMPRVGDPIVLYVLVPDLPKRWPTYVPACLLTYMFFNLLI